MAAIYALTICLVLYAIGDIVSVKTKGLLSLVFVLCVVMLIGFWCGLPTDIVTTAGIAPLGKVSASLLVVGVGTTMNTKELMRQWKTVIASFCCCTAGVLLIVFVGRFIIGTDAAIAGAPIFAGASVALMIVNEALENVGLTDTLGVVVILIFALQKYLAVTTEDAASEKKRPLSFFSKTNKPVYNFTKVALVASLSTALSALTQDKVNVYIICLVMGVLFTELGFLPRNALSKLDSYFLLLFSILMTIFSSLAKVTPQTLVQSFIPVLVVLLLGAAGVVVFAFLLSKVLKQSAWLNIALGITCTFGFPTTVMLSEEIANGVGTTDEEKSALRNYLLPQMTVAGFITVTIGSVILAGIIVPLLG